MKKPLLMALLLSLPATWGLAAAEVAEKTLANGLKVLVKEDHRSPVVVSQIWYKVGSSYEPGGVTGISHMLEHMMFKGTHKHPAGEFSRIIAEHGGEENAFTSRDYTAYFQTLAADRLPVSFELEADRMRGLNLLDEELKKEREVVTEERRMRTDDNPQAKAAEHYNAVAFTNSPYQHPIIGWPADIAHYTIADLQAWYQRWYAPNNAVVVVVGDVRADAVFALAERHFGALSPGQLTQVKPQTEVEQLGVRRLTVKVPAQLPSVAMGYKVPSLSTAANDWEAYALEVLAAVLDGGDSARLSKELVRGQQIAVAAGAGYGLHSRLGDLFELEGTPVPGKSVFELEAAFREQIARLQKDLVSADELRRIKAQVAAHAVYERDSNFFQAMQLGLLETVGLGWRKADEYVAKINQVTAEQVREVARRHLLDDRLTVAYLDPQPMAARPAPKRTATRH